MFGLGIPELLLIAFILLLLFGGKRIPDIGRGLGKTVRVIRDLSKETRGNRHEDIRSKVSKIKDEAENIPGVEEIKTIKDVSSTVKRWLWLLRR